MKQETNNEMDLLLRRLGRRHAVPASNGDSRNHSEHLDADELSSYAENVLPAAARARYTEHLAECSRCRELVVQLTGSVPVVAAKETPASSSSGLAKFLASLFSPMVLRYAVPALGLIVAAAIGVVVLRSNRPAGSIAELRAPKQPVSTAPANDQPLTYASPADTQARREAESPAADRQRRSEVAKDAEAPAPPNAAPVVGAVRVEPKVDASTQKAQEQAAVANPTPTPAQPAAPKPSETVDEMRVEAEGHKANRQRGVTDVAREQTSDLATAGRKKSDEASDKRSAKTAAAAPAQGAGSSGTFQMRDGEADAATRSVAGRRFRKVSGVWVDTAYAAGTATTNIGRGSEQYRALIADEPEIKTIAEQLDGQIIVVWKGRAYRIR